MRATITQPGLMEFSQAHKGMLFRHEAGIYVKMSDDAACVIYKHSGHMNAGSTEKFGLETKIVRVAEATFTLG